MPRRRFVLARNTRLHKRAPLSIQRKDKTLPLKCLSACKDHRHSFFYSRTVSSSASRVIEKHKDKHGVAEALKLIYREYDKNNFLYDSDSMDFTILMNKLSEEQAKKIEKSNHMSQQLFLSSPYLQFQVDTDMALSVIYSLIMNIKNKDILPHNHMETFDFMVDHLIDSLYE